jgi:prefoldin subunit 5
MKDYVDARLEAASSRTDAQIVRLETRIDGVDHKIDGLAGRMDLIADRLQDLKQNTLTKMEAFAGAVTFFIAMVGVLVGILAYGGDRADAGFGLGSTVENRLVQSQKESDAKFESLGERIENVGAKADQQFEELKALIQGLQPAAAQQTPPTPAPK